MCDALWFMAWTMFWGVVGIGGLLLVSQLWWGISDEIFHWRCVKRDNPGKLKRDLYSDG